MSVSTELPNDFIIPPAATMNTVALARRAICSQEDYLLFYTFTSGLIRSFQTERPKDHVKVAPPKILKETILYRGQQMLRSKPRYSADVLIIGETFRPAQIDCMVRLLRGVLREGLSVLYLVKLGSDEHKTVQGFVKKHGWEHRVRFLHPWQTSYLKDKLQRRIARSMAVPHFNRLLDILPKGVYTSPGTCERMALRIRDHLFWKEIEPQLDFQVAIVHNHFGGMAVDVAISAIERSKTVVTFQHGVISMPDVVSPVIAHRMLCFGSPSCNVHQRYDSRFAEFTGHPPLCREFIPAGSFDDKLPVSVNNFSKKTLLVFDQSCDWTESCYGVQHEFDTLVQAVRNVLLQSVAVKQVVVRLHPNNKKCRNWLSLKEEFPERVDISHPAFSLEFDVARSSLAIGLFSGAQCTSAACGIPIFFVWEPNWFFTPDLACFGEETFVPPSNIVHRIDELLTHESRYLEARERNLQAGREYYHQGQLCEFDQELVRRMLAPLP